VRPDGMISIPLLGDVKADGLTPVQLAALLTERLRKFVNEPQVTIIVNTINSRLIHLVGEVNRAGTFPMLPNMTLLMALSGAGGFTQFANTKKIYLLRTENGVQKKYNFNYKEVIKGNRPEENILLKPGDTIVVP
jgi:polysaccharide export outer membrane protein